MQKYIYIQKKQTLINNGFIYKAIDCYILLLPIYLFIYYSSHSIVYLLTTIILYCRHLDEDNSYVRYT